MIAYPIRHLYTNILINQVEYKLLGRRVVFDAHKHGNWNNAISELDGEINGWVVRKVKE